MRSSSSAEHVELHRRDGGRTSARARSRGPASGGPTRPPPSAPRGMRRPPRRRRRTRAGSRGRPRPRPRAPSRRSLERIQLGDVEGQRVARPAPRPARPAGAAGTRGRPSAARAPGRRARSPSAARGRAARAAPAVVPRLARRPRPPHRTTSNDCAIEASSSSAVHRRSVRDADTRSRSARGTARSGSSTDGPTSRCSRSARREADRVGRGPRRATAASTTALKPGEGLEELGQQPLRLVPTARAGPR